jgi:hypothetical protein
MWHSTCKKVQCGAVLARKYNVAKYRQESTIWHSTGKKVQCDAVPARNYNVAQYQQESTMWRSTGKKVQCVTEEVTVPSFSRAYLQDILPYKALRLASKKNFS